MLPTGGFNADLTADAVHTSIDSYIQEEYQREMQPGYVRASDAFWFKQGPTVGNAFIHDEYSGVGEFDESESDQDEITNTDIILANKTTKISVRWFKQIPISYEAFKADQLSLRERLGRDIGNRARQTQDKRALLHTYGDAFTGSYQKTPDGTTLASNSHSTVTGVTVDNLETGSLTPDNLWTATTSLANQKAQDGDAGSYLFEGILVPFTLYKTAKEVMDSSLIANSAENNENIFDTVYGQVRIGSSIFLGSTYNSDTYANTGYHVVSSSHQVMRKVFYDMITAMISPTETDNHSYAIRALFNEIAFDGSYCGYVGANGSA